MDEVIEEVIEEVSWYTVTLTLIGIYDTDPTVRAWINEGQGNWDTLFELINASCLVWMFNVEGDQLTTITQLWDDWTNELYDEILVYTRQP
ncbi:hypothetical protein LCGC14_1718200 [marine sediment metagenome]|uniref:Uncharacterized protein n=1 Tax=marine sediment metagenome TaxID=412755 RepID=A0A0F9HDI0_9ZZZZ